MKTSIKLPLVAVPALVVTGVSLLALLATVAGAASTSKPGDLLYSLRGPAMQVQSLISNDSASDEPPPQNQIVAPKPASPSELSAPSVKDSNRKANDIQISSGKSGSPESGISNQSDDSGSKDAETEMHKEDAKETEIGAPKENENDNEHETGSSKTGGDDSGSNKSGGDDSGSSSGKK